MFTQGSQPFAQQGMGQFGSQYELGQVIGAVVQGALPVILGSMRGQPQACGTPYGVPAFHQQSQHYGQQDLSHLLGPVLQATVPVILNSLRGQQAWTAGQGFAPFGVPAFHPQMGQYGGQGDVGQVL